MVTDQTLELRETLVSRARSIRPVLERNAASAEQNRELPDESFRVLVEAGLLRLCTPRRYGGLEVGHRTYFDVLTEVGRSGCGASAWYCFILNMSDWILGRMDPEAQDAVWGDGPDNVLVCPLTPTPGWQVRRVDGGFMLSGEWPYTSGSAQAQWGLIGFPILGEDGHPVDGAVGLVSRRDFAIKDTWFVTGMSGTGSNTLVIKEAFVPDKWTMNVSDAVTGKILNFHGEEYMFRSDFSATMQSCILPSLVGLAEAGLEQTLERLTTKPKPITYTFYADATRSPATQFDVARAFAMIDAAKVQGRAATDELDAQSRSGAAMEPFDRARNMLRAAHATRLCREGVDLLLDAQGASSFALVNPLQRIWRDMNTASRHGFIIPGIKEEICGKILLGADEQQMTFFK